MYDNYLSNKKTIITLHFNHLNNIGPKCLIKFNTTFWNVAKIEKNFRY
jgi:hypothetical protein